MENHGVQPFQLSHHLLCNFDTFGFVSIASLDAHESLAMLQHIIRDDDEASARGDVPLLEIFCYCNALGAFACCITYMSIRQHFQHLILRAWQHSVRTWKSPGAAARNRTATDCPHRHLVCDNTICHCRALEKHAPIVTQEDSFTHNFDRAGPPGTLLHMSPAILYTWKIPGAGRHVRTYGVPACQTLGSLKKISPAMSWDKHIVPGFCTLAG